MSVDARPRSPAQLERRCGRVHFDRHRRAPACPASRASCWRAGLAGHRLATRRTQPRSRRAAEAGRRVVHVGHDASHLAGADTVVVSSAIRRDQPRAVARPRARPAGAAPVAGPRRADGRAAGGRGRRRARQDHDDVDARRSRCSDCGRRPVLRHRRRASTRPVAPRRHDGTGDVFVAEADESDGSFLAYRPTSRSSPTSSRTTSTTTAPGGFEAAFVRFAERIVARGVGWSPAPTTPGRVRWPTRPAAAGSRCSPTATADADVRLAERRSRTAAARSGVPVARGRSAGAVALQPAGPGRHNVLNAAGAPGRSAPAARASRPDAAVAGAGAVHRHRRRFELGARPPGCGSSTTTPTTRRRSRRCSARRAAVVGGGRVVVALPAAPVLPHPDLRARTSPGALATRRRWSS